jgi:hypothetical protein
MSRRRYVLRHLAALGTAVVLGSGLLTITPRLVAAAPYDGTDPNATGCSNPAYTDTIDIRSFTTISATVELRFSRLCVTAWTRVHDYSYPSAQTFDLFIQRTAPDKLREEVDGVRLYQDWIAWTPQVYDGARYAAYAGACVHSTGECVFTNTFLPSR